MIKNEYILNFISKGVNKTKKKVDKLDNSTDKLSKTTKNELTPALGKAKIAIAALGAAIVAAAGYAIKTAAEFETLKTRLNTMYGSVNQGTKAFVAFNTVAATTPFALKSVVEAGASLKAFGVDAEKNIKGVADLAAFMGIDVVEAANAMGRAFAGGAGAADVLRDRGVLQLIKDFKGIDDLTKLTLPEFRLALEESMTNPTLGIAGSTDALSETFSGAYSNMMDSVDRLAAKMGDDLLPIAKEVVKFIGNFATEMSGSLDPLNEQVASIKNQQMEMRLLVGHLQEATVGSDNFENAMSRINREYPDLLKNIDDENFDIKQLITNYDNLVDAQNKEIQVILQRIKIQALEERLVDVYKRQFAAVEEATKSTSNLYKVLGDEAQEYFDNAEVPDFVKNSLQGNLDQLELLRAKFISMDLSPEKFQQQVGVIADSMMALFTAGDPTTGLDKLSNDLTTHFRDFMNWLPGESASVAVGDWLTKTFEDGVLATQLQVQDSLASMTQALTDYQASGGEDEAVISVLTQMIDKEKQKLEELMATYKEATKTREDSNKESLTGLQKFGKGFNKVLKSISNDENEILSTTMTAAGNIGMAMADNKAQQLEVQKFMIAGNIAKGIIDIWSEAAGKGPAGAALAAVETAGLIAKGITQTKTVEKQIAGIKATKSSVGGTQTRFAQYGMNEVVDQATPIVAGEAGAELVQITPLEGANVDGPQGGGNIVITGNVLSRDFVQGELMDELREAIRQGYDFR